MSGEIRARSRTHLFVMLGCYIGAFLNSISLLTDSTLVKTSWGGIDRVSRLDLRALMLVACDVMVPIYPQMDCVPV